VPTGTLNGNWLVGRIVPNASATGVDYYLYNQTTATDYGSVSILYSADTCSQGPTSATSLYLTFGGGVVEYTG